MLSAANNCNTSVFNGRGGAERHTSPVEDTSPLRAAARLYTGRTLVTFWLHNLLRILASEHLKIKHA